MYCGCHNVLTCYTITQITYCHIHCVFACVSNVLLAVGIKFVGLNLVNTLRSFMIVTG